MKWNCKNHWIFQNIYLNIYSKEKQLVLLKQRVKLLVLQGLDRYLEIGVRGKNYNPEVSNGFSFSDFLEMSWFQINIFLVLRVVYL